MAEFISRNNVTVTQYGLPHPGAYKATRKSDGYFYIQIDLGVRQSRKWIRPSEVAFKSEVTEVLIEKASEL